MGCLRAGMAVRTRGKVDASQEHRMQYEDTKANWTSVRVAGLSKAVKMDLDDVFVNAEDQYHIKQSIFCVFEERDISNYWLFTRGGQRKHSGAGLKKTG